MFGRSVTLFKLFGFEVKIDFSWLILGMLISWSLAKGFFPSHYRGLSTETYWAMGVASAFGLLISVVFHELWHSLVARRFGVPMRGITLFIFGGVAEMTEEPPHPRAEFFMAIAGPISSIFLGLIFLGLGYFAPAGGWPRPVAGVLVYLGILNLVLAGFNLIPAFPLDGGRILRAILWGWKNNLRRATRVASQFGGAFGLILIFLGALDFIFGNMISGLWLFLIGLFLRGASQTAYRQLLIRQAFEGERVRRFMKEEPISVSSTITLQQLVDDFILKHHFEMFPVVDNDHLIGCITLNQVKEIPREQWALKQVSEVMARCGVENTIEPDKDALEALSQMNRVKSSRLMVVDKGKILGMIALKDMMKFISLKLDLEG